MEKTYIPLKLIYDYVSKEEVGYQIAGELVDIANPDNKIKTLRLLNEIKKAKEAMLIINKSDVDIITYKDMLDWSEPSDTLVLIDNDILLLFPKHIDTSYPTFSKLIENYIA